MEDQDAIWQQKLATEPSGNTKCRRFQLTLNEVERWPKLMSYIIELKSFRYGIACLERAPTTGHQHIHFYVCFNNPIKVNVKKAQGAHIEVCRGSHDKNVAYIKKEGDIIFEEGEPPQQGTPYTVKDLENADLGSLPWNMYNIAAKVQEHKTYNFDIDELYKEVKIIYIYGPSGIGKTERAKQIVRDNAETYGRVVNFVKYENGFWSGIPRMDAPKVCIYDEFRDSDMRPKEFIQFIDYNIHTMNVKGGHVLNKFELIIITSVQSPEEIYEQFTLKNEEPKRQWLRRMEVIEMKDEQNVENIVV